MTLSEIIAQQRHSNPTQRIIKFMYADQSYWIKQVEATRGVMRLLKGNPRTALQREIHILSQLNRVNAPCAAIIESGEDYLVLSDVGTTAYQKLNHAGGMAEKIAIVMQCAKALANLHQLDLVHGRPALRDMGVKEGKVRFIDFESDINHANLEYNKVRDLLVFLHDIYRSGHASPDMVQCAINTYKINDGEQIYQKTEQFLLRWRWLYYLLKPFHIIAGKDLLAGLNLFDFFLRGKKI